MRGKHYDHRIRSGPFKNARCRVLREIPETGRVTVRIQRQPGHPMPEKGDEWNLDPQNIEKIQPQPPQPRGRKRGK